jgi:hypothetical protein
MQESPRWGALSLTRPVFLPKIMGVLGTSRPTFKARNQPHPSLELIERPDAFADRLHEVRDGHGL